MASLLLDIGTFLTAAGYVSGDGVDFFRDFTPPEPDDVVVVHEYPGSPATPFDALVHRSLQFKVRGTDPETVRAKALAIFTLLTVENRRITFTDDRWGLVYLRQPPFKTDVDDTHRVTYMFNAGITTRGE